MYRPLRSVHDRNRSLPRGAAVASMILLLAMAHASLGQEAASSLDTVLPQAFQAPHTPAEHAQAADAAPGYQTGESQKTAATKELRTPANGSRNDKRVMLAAAQETAGPAQTGAPAARRATRDYSPKPLSHAEKPKPLASSAGASGHSSLPGGLDSLMTVLGSFGIALGLFVVVMWCLRRSVPKSAQPLPPEVVEVLGRAQLSTKQQMHLIRFGGKLVLISATPGGVDAISEITDPQEVDRIAGHCEQGRGSFRGILDRLESWNDAEEPDRRPSRSLGSVLGMKNRRAEDEYV